MTAPTTVKMGFARGGFITFILQSVNQKRGDARFGFYMRCVMSAPSLSCALRTVDAASARAAMRADGEDGREEGVEGGVSLSLFPSLSHPSLRFMAQIPPTLLRYSAITSAHAHIHREQISIVARA